MTNCTPLTSVLEEDPALARHLSPAQAESATPRAGARVISVAKGVFWHQETIPSECGALGMLVLDGLLFRGLSVAAARPSVEVLGPGDAFRLFERDQDPCATVPAGSRWWALRPARLAVLDASFTRAMSEYPEVIGELASRFWRRSAASSRGLAIVQQSCLAERLRLMLWHLADRFGREEGGEMVLMVPLCHTLLSWLVCARRPAVSRALKELERAELIASRPDGTWWLGSQRPEGFGELTLAAQPTAA